MIEQLLYHYLAKLYGNPVVHGRVLNIGLGQGLSARLLLHLRTVSQVVTIENNSAVILVYEETYRDNLEKNHLIECADAQDMDPIGLFDCVFFDIVNLLPYDGMMKALSRVKECIHPTSHIIIEWNSDTDDVQRLRKWLQENFQEIRVRAELAPLGSARAGPMFVYKPKLHGE